LLVGYALAPRPAHAERRLDRIIAAPQRDADVIALGWSDAEEELDGTVSPARPRVGEELVVRLLIGSFEGSPFDGPVTVALRGPGQAPADIRTVARGASGWEARFRPTQAGVHQLDVSFRTTHHKVLHGSFEVEPPHASLLYGWLALGALATGGAAYGVRRMLRRMGAGGSPASPA
jgi:hypothetical protein